MSAVNYQASGKESNAVIYLFIGLIVLIGFLYLLAKKTLNDVKDALPSLPDISNFDPFAAQTEKQNYENLSTAFKKLAVEKSTMGKQANIQTRIYKAELAKMKNLVIPTLNNENNSFGYYQNTVVYGKPEDRYTEEYV